VEALTDTMAASGTLPSTDALSMRQSRPTLEEGVPPAVQLNRAFKARWHDTLVVVASRAEAHLAEAQVLGK
jgi:hypothetical protein